MVPPSSRRGQPSLRGRTLAKTSQYLVSILLTLILVLEGCYFPVVATEPEVGVNHGPALTRQDLHDRGEVSFHSLFTRVEPDDHTCTKDRECRNGACCGSSGVCGYGPVYCGIGCMSNCDAKAECGQFSADGEATCPLNVCCSEFGFCGTTAEFCDPSSGCQSNCGNPSSPGSGGNVRTRVVGYYESWSSYSGRCGSLKPSQIPSSALDILNFAFAYISPETADIIPMVGEHGETLSESEAAKLYAAVTAPKLGNPKMGVWLAIGGWTFSDNNTIFQPVFGDISSTEVSRRQFALNLVKFMQQYGFDGVDIDWEYPGASDRGGSIADYENFPLLLKAIRETFNTYGFGRWGISITAPSSYWYLRWFNLPELVKYVNFINLMSYDLHGIWDKQNEIGSQILAHTNLTEVDQALELFWRNQIDPAMINLGVAFYGRSYTLADASCAKPGCKFKGPGAKGQCSNTAGYLSYREIMQKIDAAGGSADQIWDKQAGVKMVVYDSSNWISYDDSTTFQQKVDFANERGLAGLMIWAIDQDDDGFNALQALTNKNVDPTSPESDLMSDFDISRCYYTDCGGDCSEHIGFKKMTRLNLDERGNGCPKSGKDSQQRALCCPPWGAPSPETCRWTDNCKDDCREGEITLALDNYGGGEYCPSNHLKQFCCPASNIDRAVKECEWYRGSICPGDKPQYLTYSGISSLCCPAKPKFKTSTCDWHGTPVFCSDTNCPVGQITVARSDAATPLKGSRSDANGCYTGGEKSFCCDAPYGESSSGTLPVQLDHLFPEYKEIPVSDEAVYKEALDSVWAWDVDPDNTPFARVVMVGPPENVQSLDKRDGSALETFDCPNPRPDDYGVQTFKAVCMAESDEHDCDDLLLGDGAYGTIARLPKSCGPDEWVRVVSFREIDNSTLPHHLSKRTTHRSKVYEIKYDYNIRDVANDEIFVRIDSSTHEHYWNKVIASPLQSKKRSDDRTQANYTAKMNWREPHMEWFQQHESRKRGAGNTDWWKNLFSGFLKDGLVSKSQEKSYDFDQVLYQASINCPPNFDASMNAKVKGGVTADIDYGVSLIGRVKDTKFEQAFAYISLRKFSANVQLSLEGEAQFTFESQEAHLLSNFAPWGGSFNIKGLVTIGPFMDITAQIDAIATISGSFSSGVNIGTQDSASLDWSPLTWMYPPSMDVIPNSNALHSGMFPETISITASREVSVAAKGSIALTVTPSVAFKVQVDINGLLQTSTHITAAFPNRMVLGVGTSESCSGGLQYWMDYEQSFNLNANTSSLGWDMPNKNIYKSSKRLLYPKCYSFGSDNRIKPRIMNRAILETHTLSGRAEIDDQEPAVNPLFPDPTGRCLVCATDTYYNDGNCGRVFDDDGNLLDPKCKATGGSSSERRATNAGFEPPTQKYEDHLRWFKERALEKRGAKSRFTICQSSAPNNQYSLAITVKALYYPSSGKLMDLFAGGNLKTYAPSYKGFINDDDEYDFGFGRRDPPLRDTSASWDAEHVLEHQTLKAFLETYTDSMQQGSIRYPNAAAKVFQDIKKFKKDSWIKFDDWDFCQHLKFWLDTIPLEATWYDSKVSENSLGRTIVQALPNNKLYWDKLPLLDEETNGAKLGAWGGAENPRDVEACLANDPPNYADAICLMGKVLNAIRYHQLVEDILVKQANRIVDFLDAMEDAAASFNDQSYVKKPYIRLGISKYFKKWMYEDSATAGKKMAGLLNENIPIIRSKLANTPQANPGNPAGGGTTTGAQQGNARLLEAIEALENQYAGQGPWSYGPDHPNPFAAWKDEPSLARG